MPRILAPAADTLGVAVARLPPLSPVLSAPALRSPRPRTAAAIMTIMTIMAAAPPITAATPIMADMAMAGAIMVAPAGKPTAFRTHRSVGRLTWPADFFLLALVVNTLATGF